MFSNVAQTQTREPQSSIISAQKENRLKFHTKPKLFLANSRFQRPRFDHRREEETKTKKTQFTFVNLLPVLERDESCLSPPAFDFGRNMGKCSTFPNIIQFLWRSSLSWNLALSHSVSSFLNAHSPSLSFFLSLFQPQREYCVSQLDSDPHFIAFACSSKRWYSWIHVFFMISTTRAFDISLFLVLFKPLFVVG